MQAPVPAVGGLARRARHRRGGRRARVQQHRTARGARRAPGTVAPWRGMTGASLFLLLPVAVVQSSPADLTVVNSLGPVRANETVVSFAPNYLPTTQNGDTKVKLCTASAGCHEPQIIQVADGVVHWVLDAPTDQYSYSLCLGSTCGPPAHLNHAELMWHQCVGISEAAANPAAGNGLRCAPGGVIRLFGKGLAFDGPHCAAYSPYVRGAGKQHEISLAYLRLTRTLQGVASSTEAPIELASATASCYDATFVLPNTLAPGSYSLEVKSNLPSATWQVARDPDQRTLAIAEPPVQQCDSSGKTFTASTVTSLRQAFASAAARKGGATVVVKGTITLENADVLTVPNCTVLQGIEGESGEKRVSAATGKLRWMPHGGALGVDCGMKNTYLVEVAGTGITVQDLAIEAVALRGCTGLVGAKQSVGLTLRNLNVTAFASMQTQAVFVPIISLRSAANFLVEGSTFLHCGNNTPGDAHAGVNAPILEVAASTDGVIQNNLWMVGLSGWHLDQSVHIVMESNTFTGFFDDDVKRPLPNFDGSFWFSSYGQGPFPGAGRFFYANTTQNERPHSKPQVGGGESFTLDGGNSGGYYGRIKEIVAANDSSSLLTLSGTPCWKTVGGYSLENCTLPAAPGKTGHAVQIIQVSLSQISDFPICHLSQQSSPRNLSRVCNVREIWRVVTQRFARHCSAWLFVCRVPAKVSGGVWLG